jgi:NAD(P)-dependent dehydrogenase (short-subunit alcohol dehydrogenase family)
MTDMIGKVALVTGGGSGMGRIIALRLAARGAKVAIFDVNDQGMAETVERGDNICAFNCDISSIDAVETNVAEVISQLGPIDHMVHAAALMPSHKLINETHDSMARLFSINYFGMTYLVQAVLPAMLARDAGRIIVFGSIAGSVPVPHMGAYCATKSAVNTYVEVLQNEIGGSNVNVHLICPPAVNTPLIDQAIGTDTPGSILEAKKSGRLADPEKIVDAIDKGVAKGKHIIYPGEAKLLLLWHAMFPRLWWKVVLKFEK